MTTKEEVAPAKGINTPHMEPWGTPSYAEWAAAYQAYYGKSKSAPYPGFFPAVAVASGPPSHPYNWGGQPLIGPYGNTAFPCMYPYGYPHPTLTPGAVPYSPFPMPSPYTELVMATPPTDVKSSLASEARQNAVINAAVGSDEATKETSGSECGTGGVSDRSEDECTPKESETVSKDSVKTSQNRKCVVGMLADLNSAVDYWSATTPIRLQGKRDSADLSATSITSLSSPQLLVHSQDGMNSDVWSQDDKETKRQRRKQSNRESARRSRLRKQAECEELGARVDGLMAENTSLRTELDRLSEECKKLFAENAVILQKSMRRHKGKTAEATQEADESSEKQATQLEEVGYVEDISCNKTIYHIPNETRMTTLRDLGASVLPLMGRTDRIAAS